MNRRPILTAELLTEARGGELWQAINWTMDPESTEKNLNELWRNETRRCGKIITF